MSSGRHSLLVQLLTGLQVFKQQTVSSPCPDWALNWEWDQGESADERWWDKHLRLPDEAEQTFLRTNDDTAPSAWVSIPASNLKNTMKAHFSLRPLHGRCSLLLPERSWVTGGSGEHGGPGFRLLPGLNFIRRISITKASSAVSRRDLGACQGRTEEVNSPERTPPFTRRPNRSLSVTPSVRPLTHLFLLLQQPESLHYAALMAVEGFPKEPH